MTVDNPIHVGVLSLHNSKESKAICNAVEALGHNPVWLRKENLTISIQDGVVHLEPDVDVIANRLLLSQTDQPCEELGLAASLQSLRPMLNRPENVLRALHKFATGTALASADISVPDCFLAMDGPTLNEGRKQFGEEAVFKTAIGTHGGGTWKVGSEEQVNPTVGNRQAFLQELITPSGNERYDLRIYVVDGEIVAAMRRFAPSGDWRTNVALGGRVEDATDDLAQEAATLALKATEAINLDYAGVDIVASADDFHVLEVNPTAGFRGLYKATGVSPAPVIAKAAIERAGGSVDPALVDELTRTLDDSVPSCKPRPPREQTRETIVIGFTEEVIVSGTTGSKTVIAKSDTGATRTSIDTQLAAEIGAGPIKSIAKIRSGSMKSAKSRPVVDLVVGVGGTQHTVTATIEDRNHMENALLLGRDILEHYQVDVTRRADSEGELEAEE